MGTKYGHLIKPLEIGTTDWKPGTPAVGPGGAGREIRLNGRDHLEGLKMNFSWGVHRELGDWHGGLDPHVHPYPECLLFVGLDTANVNYLGARVEICLGPEQESYSFDEPTAVVIPAGLPHGPIATKRMFSPKGFGFWAIELNPVPEVTWLGEGVSGIPAEQLPGTPAEPDKILRNKPTAPTGKYAHLLKPLRSGLFIERGKINAARFTAEEIAAQEEHSRKSGDKAGPGYPDHLVWMQGRDLENLDAGIFWGFCSRPGIWRRGSGAHTHPTDEILVYLGTDPEQTGTLGAEIEIDMGQEHERHLIDRPAAVICPAGVPHTPQVTRWVDRPFAFLAVNLSREHEIKAAD